MRLLFALTVLLAVVAAGSVVILRENPSSPAGSARACAKHDADREGGGDADREGGRTANGLFSGPERELGGPCGDTPILSGIVLALAVVWLAHSWRRLVGGGAISPADRERRGF